MRQVHLYVKGYSSTFPLGHTKFLIPKLCTPGMEEVAMIAEIIITEMDKLSPESFQYSKVQFYSHLWNV